MSDLAYKYYNQLDTLDLSDLEILLDKINSLIFTKKGFCGHANAFFIITFYLLLFQQSVPSDFSIH